MVAGCTLSPAKLERAEEWFERFGFRAVFLARIEPIVRSFISIPADVFRTRLLRYTALTVAGSALWCFSLAGAGWALGASYQRFHRGFRYADYAVVIAVAFVLAFTLADRLHRARGRS